MSNEKLDSDINGSANGAETDVQESNADAFEAPTPRETEAIAARPYHFSVDGFALREAFLATSLTSAGDQLRMRILNDHLTLVSHNDGIHCEADVEILPISGIPADRPVVVETQSSLFADFLCNQLLWKGKSKAQATKHDGEPIDFVATLVARNNGVPIGQLASGEWRIKFRSLEIDWPFTVVNEEETRDIAQAGRPAHPHMISRALSLVRELSDTKTTARPLHFVYVMASRASAGSTSVFRMVNMPELADVDLRIARKNAGGFISVLKQYDPQATQMWIGEREWGFNDARRRCVVAIETGGQDLAARLFDRPPRSLGSAVISTHEFNMSVNKILSQKKAAADDRIGMTLRGDGNGTLRFSLPVNGGAAVVTCPVLNISVDNDTTPLETREFWFGKDSLAKAIAFPSAKEIELQLFQEAVLFKQVDGDRTAQTLLANRKMPRSTPLPAR
jgi:hypothetical protein